MVPETPAISDIYSKTAGLVLAGGIARRLGGADKASLRVGGIPLLERALTSLSGQCSKLTVVSRSETPLPTPAGMSVLHVQDQGTGPAAAVLLAARRIATEFPGSQLLLITPVDAPFAPKSFVERAAPMLLSSLSAVVGTHDGRTYPTHSLWQLDALLEIAERIPDAANLSLYAILDQVEWKTLSFADFATENPFANINTPVDLVACNRRARDEKST